VPTRTPSRSTGAAPLLAIAAAAGLILTAAGSAAAAGEAVAVSPAADLSAGQKVTVTATGFGAGDTLIIGQCTPDAKGQEGCAAGALSIKAGADGSATGTLTIVVGTVGTKGGTCDATHPCAVAVTDLSTIGQPTGPTVVTKAITFAAAGGGGAAGNPSTATPTASKGAPATATPSPGAKSTSTAPPGGELAHTGGDRIPLLRFGVAGTVLVFLGVGALFLVRRRSPGTG
jgi:hypothetical protein